MSTINDTPNTPEPRYLGIKPALEAAFEDASTRPSIRTWNEWRAKGYYPYIKVNKRVFIDPVQAIKALEARFTIKANG